MTDILEKLNPEQKLPVMDTEGAVLVIAGAGSGKTRVLTSRIAYLVLEKQVKPANILAITFTNKAAKEMKERLNKLVDGAEKMWVSTIHSMCVKILRSDISKLNKICVGGNYNTNFTIYDDIDREKVIKRVCEPYKSDDDLQKKLKYHIATAKNRAEDPDEYERNNKDTRNIKLLCQLFREYENSLKKSNALDFDDLLVMTYRLLYSDAETREYYSSMFHYIHVDEFQDTNRVQFRIIELLASYHRNLFVVGDDDQSIYGWRGAEIANILNFEKKFIGAKTYKLEQNYRSTKKILDLANTVISNNIARNNKRLWTENDAGARIDAFTASDENDEAMYVALEIKKTIEKFNLKPNNFAVLMRVNALTRAFEQEFTKYGLPYRIYGGFRFFERREIKDLLAYLKLINNPLDDEALFRIINVPKRGIGDKTIDVIKTYAYTNGVSVFDAVCEVENLTLSASVKNKIAEFKDRITELIVDKELLPLPEFTKALVEKTHYRDMFEADSEENLNKLMNLDEFQNTILQFAKANTGATLSEYLNSVTLSSDVDSINEDEAITVATIHAVKGLEFKCVFIVGLEETIFPISRASTDNDELEEERRLMYVAITRAREKLYLTRARSRFLYGDRAFMTESRFLKELRPVLSPFSVDKAKETTSGRMVYGSEDLGNSSKHGSGYSSTYAESYIKRAEERKEKSNNALTNYVSGDKVSHAKFGIGTIIAVKGFGANMIVDVAFRGVGVKSLSAQFAPMQKV